MQRHDTAHQPVLQADGSVRCSACGLVLPTDIGAAAITIGMVVVDVGGYGEAFYPEEPQASSKAVIACTHPTAEAERLSIALVPCSHCLDSGFDVNHPNAACRACGGAGVLAEVHDPTDPEHPRLVPVNTEAVHPGAGEEVKRAMPLTEVERMANRGSFANWIAMRQAVREGMVEQPRSS